MSSQTAGSATLSTTPPGTPGRQPDPVTPDNNLRNRRPTQYTPMPGEISPASSTLSGGSRFFNSQIPFGLSTLSSSVVHIESPGRGIRIRADPALVTCFDSSDKELYDLWAPK
ncbi:hypothetical protein QCA50_000504 [Cerrena zonata]|uniref:Uncharacterized protein n=1 Tax=Cerrena zonata TaxID=2478898 RepID=A0AAW0H011_9APHY